MKKTLALLAMTAIAIGAPQAFAGQGGDHGGRGHFFQKADTNNDGFLTRQEMEAKQKERLDNMFTHVDGDKDGKLSKDELKKGHEEMRAKMRERFKNRQDKQGDNLPANQE